MASMDFTNRHGIKEDGANKLDIDMLVKLTTRLQKASHTYESLRGDMDKIKEVLTYLCVLFTRNTFLPCDIIPSFIIYPKIKPRLGVRLRLQFGIKKK